MFGVNMEGFRSSTAPEDSPRIDICAEDVVVVEQEDLGRRVVLPPSQPAQ